MLTTRTDVEVSGKALAVGQWTESARHYAMMATLRAGRELHTVDPFSFFQFILRGAVFTFYCCFFFNFFQAAASCTTGLSDDGSQKEHTEPPAPAPATAPHNGDHESATGNVEDPGKIRRLRRLTRRSSVRTFQKGPK